MLLWGVPPAARLPPSLLLRIPPSFPFDSMLWSLIPTLSGETLPAIAQLADYFPGGDGSRPPTQRGARGSQGGCSSGSGGRLLEHKGGRCRGLGVSAGSPALCIALCPSFCPQPGLGDTSYHGDSWHCWGHLLPWRLPALPRCVVPVWAGSKARQSAGSEEHSCAFMGCQALRTAGTWRHRGPSAPPAPCGPREHMRNHHNPCPPVAMATLATASHRNRRQWGVLPAPHPLPSPTQV